jgi:putative membrane protein
LARCFLIEERGHRKVLLIFSIVIMQSIIARLVVTALAIFLVTNVVDGISVSSFPVAFAAAFVLSFANIFIKPILSILTLPINIVTLGLSSLLITTSMFALVAYAIDGFEISGIVPAFFGALVVSAASTLAHKILT